MREAAAALGIELAFLPQRAPELNPCEDLWRQLKGTIAANRAQPTIDEQAERASAWLDTLAPADALQRSGLRSSKFDWLPT